MQDPLSPASVFESFNPKGYSTATTADDQNLLECDLSSFETGYRSGWNDASATNEVDLKECIRLLTSIKSAKIRADSSEADILLSYFQRVLMTVLENIFDVGKSEFLTSQVLSFLRSENKRDDGQHIFLKTHPSQCQKISMLLNGHPEIGINCIADEECKAGDLIVSTETTEYLLSTDKIKATVISSIQAIFPSNDLREE